MKKSIGPWTNIFPTPALLVAAFDGACRVIFAGAVKQ